MDYIDLHSHILPGLDDGPEDLPGSIDLVRALVRLGFSHVFATPHHRLYSWQGLSVETVERSVRELRTAVAASGVEVTIHPGMEYDIDEEIELRTAHRPNGSRFVLIDPGFYHVPDGLPDLLRPFQEKGMIPVIVHPERNEELCRDAGLLRSVREVGARLLGNLGSLGGLYGRSVRWRGLDLLRNGDFWALASDSHRMGQAVYLERGMTEVVRRAGPSALEELLRTNPREVVLDREEHR